MNIKKRNDWEIRKDRKKQKTIMTSKQGQVKKIQTAKGKNDKPDYIKIVSYSFISLSLKSQ